MMARFDIIKAQVGWDKNDKARIATMRSCLDSNDSDVVDALAKRLTQLNGMQPLMSNMRFARRLYGVLREWLMGLLDGTFDGERSQERWTLGQRLVDVDLTFEDLILLEGLARKQLFELAQERVCESPDSLSEMMYTLDKALNLDLMLIYSGYLQVRDTEMERALLDRFIAVTGFSRTLYENLAEAHGREQVGSSPSCVETRALGASV